MNREICHVLASTRRRVRGRDLFLSPQMEVFKKPSIAEIRLHTHTRACARTHTHNCTHTPAGSERNGQPFKRPAGDKNR